MGAAPSRETHKRGLLSLDQLIGSTVAHTNNSTSNDKCSVNNSSNYVEQEQEKRTINKKIVKAFNNAFIPLTTTTTTTSNTNSSNWSSNTSSNLIDVTTITAAATAANKCSNTTSVPSTQNVSSKKQEIVLIPLTKYYFPSPDCPLFVQFHKARCDAAVNYYFRRPGNPGDLSCIPHYNDKEEQLYYNEEDNNKSISNNDNKNNKEKGDYESYPSREALYRGVIDHVEEMLFDTDAEMCEAYLTQNLIAQSSSSSSEQAHKSKMHVAKKDVVNYINKNEDMMSREKEQHYDEQLQRRREEHSSLQSISNNNKTEYDTSSMCQTNYRYNIAETESIETHKLKKLSSDTNKANTNTESLLLTGTDNANEKKVERKKREKRVLPVLCAVAFRTEVARSTREIMQENKRTFICNQLNCNVNFLEQCQQQQQQQQEYEQEQYAILASHAATERFVKENEIINGSKIREKDYSSNVCWNNYSECKHDDNNTALQHGTNNMEERKEQQQYHVLAQKNNKLAAAEPQYFVENGVYAFGSVINVVGCFGFVSMEDEVASYSPAMRPSAHSRTSSAEHTLTSRTECADVVTKHNNYKEDENKNNNCENKTKNINRNLRKTYHDNNATTIIANDKNIDTNNDNDNSKENEVVIDKHTLENCTRNDSKQVETNTERCKSCELELKKLNESSMLTKENTSTNNDELTLTTITTNDVIGSNDKMNAMPDNTVNKEEWKNANSLESNNNYNKYENKHKFEESSSSSLQAVRMTHIYDSNNLIDKDKTNKNNDDDNNNNNVKNKFDNTKYSQHTPCDRLSLLTAASNFNELMQLPPPIAAPLAAMVYLTKSAGEQNLSRITHLAACTYYYQLIHAGVLVAPSSHSLSHGCTLHAFPPSVAPMSTTKESLPTSFSNNMISGKCCKCATTMHSHLHNPANTSETGNNNNNNNNNNNKSTNCCDNCANNTSDHSVLYKTSYDNSTREDHINHINQTQVAIKEHEINQAMSTENVKDSVNDNTNMTRSPVSLSVEAVSAASALPPSLLPEQMERVLPPLDTFSFSILLTNIPILSFLYEMK